MRRRLRLILPLSLCALVLASSAESAVLLGVHGDPQRLRNQTGQRSDGQLIFLGWGQGHKWGRDLAVWLPMLGDVPIVSFGTGTKPPKREAISPRAIANGKGDGFLKSMNRKINEFGGPVIMRPLAEMNGHWNYYSAYNANGTKRNAAHSTKNFRRAFRRIYLILHGGDRATINAKLARSDMPGIGSDLPENPKPTLQVLWNPQGFGSPNLPGNSAHAYYPGDEFVDMVGNDVYDIRGRAAWDANLALFKRYPNKPYAMGEFGLWGIDDPAFIRQMASFIRNRGRVKLAIFFQAKSGSIFDLGTKPRSRAAYRTYMTPLNK